MAADLASECFIHRPARLTSPAFSAGGDCAFVLGMRRVAIQRPGLGNAGTLEIASGSSVRGVSIRREWGSSYSQCCLTASQSVIGGSARVRPHNWWDSRIPSSIGLMSAWSSGACTRRSCRRFVPWLNGVAAALKSAPSGRPVLRRMVRCIADDRPSWMVLSLGQFLFLCGRWFRVSSW
jgi:hypothetical protein